MVHDKENLMKNQSETDKRISYPNTYLYFKKKFKNRKKVMLF